MSEEKKTEFVSLITTFGNVIVGVEDYKCFLIDMNHIAPEEGVKFLCALKVSVMKDPSGRVLPRVDPLVMGSSYETEVIISRKEILVISRITDEVVLELIKSTTNPNRIIPVHGSISK